MKNKVEVKICVGTYSYVMGGADLLDMDADWSDDWKEKVRISGSISLDGCDELTMKPPFASVNGKIITEASVEKVSRMIQKELNLITA